MTLLNRLLGHGINLNHLIMATAIVSAAQLGLLAAEPAADQQIYNSRPNPKKEKEFGPVGVTGIEARIYPGVVVKVEKVTPGTPSEGKFSVGDAILGVNGVVLEGKNPYVTLGEALTGAETTDGKLAFDVKTPAGEKKIVEITIPVLGAYGDRWPLTCKKSTAIVKAAAEYYAKDKGFAKRFYLGTGEGPPIGAALACLFLMSTGDDTYLPPVKAYMDRTVASLPDVGHHTWNNGYNGVACAEYYLRTGDKSVLPLLQYYCDDAKKRQHFNSGWKHWGMGINPRYVAGGLMNPAGSQVLTTLLLSKECGVTVDDKTLTNALTYWYRFVGHGTVPYGDHRAEGGLGSNGKDAMAAAIMQVASYAQGDVSIYKNARNYLSMATITSYPCMVTGHADNGRGDGIWRGIASSYMLDLKPADYHDHMNRIRWWLDLSRRPSGAFGMATCKGHNDEGSGAGVALAYTAPLKTLRITGAPKSRHAKKFSLPSYLWGNVTDKAFLDMEHNPNFAKYGKEEPIHVPYRLLGNAYGNGALDPKTLKTEDVIKYVYHKRYMVRAQAAKKLMHAGAFKEIEAMLNDPDPRVRRAGLDGMIDYRYWFAMGKKTIAANDVTPGMIASIKRMLADPKEAIYVVDGALMALSCAPPKEIEKCLPLILPWTMNKEWWLRQSAFFVFSAMAADEALRDIVLPTMLTMLKEEYHTMPRGSMQGQLDRLLRTCKPGSKTYDQIIAGFVRNAKEGTILPGEKAGEGAYNVIQAAKFCLSKAPSSALEVAKVVHARFAELETGQISAVVKESLAVKDKLAEADRQALLELLYNEYRNELIRRMETEKPALDTILSLTKIKKPNVKWSPLGTKAPAERVWRFTSFDGTPEEALHRREGKRFRDVTLPQGVEGWFAPGFDDSKWPSGKAPIGKGLFAGKRDKKTPVKNGSTWGAGEFVVMRTTFEIQTLDFDFYRISVLANQGFHIYLNGHKIHTYIWWNNDPVYRKIGLGPEQVKHLKKGTNTLAVYANMQYKDEKEEVGQIDVYLEGLKKSELIK